MRGLSGKVAIVTGGGQGIGRAISLRLAEEGCKVAIFDINPDAGLETAKLSPRSAITTYPVDVGDRASVDRAVAQVEAEIRKVVKNSPRPFGASGTQGFTLRVEFRKTSLLHRSLLTPERFGPANTRVDT